jgi:hypothetical protein
MTAVTDASLPVSTDARQTKLAERVGRLRGRAGLGDRWLLVLGGLLLPLGVLLVLMGWKGAADTPLVFEQVPYLISGGVLGLALVIAGIFLYFAYWLTLLVRENREGRAQLVAVLSRMETLLQEGGAAPRTARTAAPGGALVATRTGTMYHRPDCVAVDGKADLRTVTAGTPGLTPCKLCDPS